MLAHTSLEVRLGPARLARRAPCAARHQGARRERIRHAAFETHKKSILETKSNRLAIFNYVLVFKKTRIVFP